MDRLYAGFVLLDLRYPIQHRTPHLGQMLSMNRTVLPAVLSYPRMDNQQSDCTQDIFEGAEVLLNIGTAKLLGTCCEH